MAALLEVSLNTHPPNGRVAHLRELCGRDEMEIDLRRPCGSTALLERLLAASPSTDIARLDAWALSLADRDRLLAAVFEECFGEQVEFAVPCRSCNEDFEVAFSLRGLLADLAERRSASGVEGPDAEGTYTLSNGIRFRLPTGDDERSVAGLPEDQAVGVLVRRCLLGATDGTADLELLQTAMDKVGPVLDLDLPSRCASCGAEQTVRFDLAMFFAATLERERPLLVREVHRLASAYHWSLSDILALSRRERRAYVALAEAEHRAQWGASA